MLERRRDSTQKLLQWLCQFLSDDHYQAAHTLYEEKTAYQVDEMMRHHLQENSKFPRI